MVKNPPANAGDAEMQFPFLGWEDPPEKEMVTHSSILAWRIPWSEKPGRLQSTGSQESDTTERLHLHTFSHYIRHQALDKKEVLRLVHL